jgi:hypothetical protein
MNLRVLVAAIVGAIVMFFLGYLIYGLALASFMQANTIQYPGLMKDPPEFIALGLSNLAFAWLYAFIFDNWAGIKTFVGGVLGGISIAIPLALAVDLQYLAFMNIYKSLIVILVDIVAIAVMNGIAGGVMGLIIGKMSPK